MQLLFYLNRIRRGAKDFIAVWGFVKLDSVRNRYANTRKLKISLSLHLLILQIATHSSFPIISKFIREVYYFRLNTIYTCIENLRISRD